MTEAGFSSPSLCNLCGTLTFFPKANEQLILSYTSNYFLVFHNTIIKGVSGNGSGSLVSAFAAACRGLAHCCWREAGGHWVPLGLGKALLGWMKSWAWKTGIGLAKGWNCVHRR